MEIKQPNTNGQVAVYAKDYGVNPANDNNRANLQRAIDYCKELGVPAKLVMEPGVYWVKGDQLVFDGLADFVLEGNGCKFVYSKDDSRRFAGRSLFYLENLTRCAFENFTVDWDYAKDPLAVPMQITGMDPSGNIVDFQFLNQEDADAVRNWTTGEEADAKYFQDFLPYNPNRPARDADGNPTTPGSLGVDGKEEIWGYRSDLPHSRFARYAWVTDDIIKFYTTSNEDGAWVNSNLAVGDVYLARHYVYNMTGGDGICAFHMCDNHHLTMNTVNITATPGMGYVIRDGQANWQLLNCKVAIDPADERRYISATADHLHGYNTGGYWLIDGCEFGYGGDDGINMHDNIINPVTKVHANTVSMNHGDALWRTVVKPGDTLELRKPDGSAYDPVWRAAVTKVDGRLVTLDTDLPDDFVDNHSILFNRSFDSGNYIVQNSYFHNNRARGMLIKCDNGIVRNNKFYSISAAAMHIQMDAISNSWNEGYGVDNVVIAGNTFDSCNVESQHTGGYVIYMEANTNGNYTPAMPVFTNITLEKNTFRNFPGIPLLLSACADMRILNNVFYAEKESAIYDGVGSHITCAGNEWEIQPK